MKTNKKGFILISAYLVIMVLAVLTTAMILLVISESKAVEKQLESVQAFYLAEAALDKAISQLPADETGGLFSFGAGEYNLSITPDALEPDTKWTVTGTGYIPSAASPRATRIVRGVVTYQGIDPSAFGVAIYTAGEIEIKGNSYSVNGESSDGDDNDQDGLIDEAGEGGTIYYGGEKDVTNEGNITGGLIQDTSISPLFALDYGVLRDIAVSQGNLYTAEEIAGGSPPLPASFWYDEAASMPNVVYIESDLELNGNVGTIGGFLVVAGDVMTNPDAAMDFEINGNGQIDGVIYTRGEFEINGGGNGLNVNGGVFAGEDAELKGSSSVTYNEIYMDAVESINLTTSAQLLSWQEVK